MTEKEWLTATDPTPMLKFLWGGASHRKLRLFVCACCRRIWRLLPEEPAQVAIRFAEAYADAGITGSEGDHFRHRIDVAIQGTPDPQQAFIRSNTLRSPLQAVAYALRASLPAREAVNGAKWAAAAAGWAALDGMAKAVARRASRWETRKTCAEGEEQHIQACLVRDVFGNPFRPVTIERCWRTETVVALATVIYADCAFDRLPILADAMEEAGCDNMDILSHCRGEGQHVRGCWVVDLILGKS